MNDEIILNKFSERLFNLIKQHSTDINVLAQKMGIKSNSTIYRYMNGEMSPKITTVKYLAEYYNVNPVWLMGYDVPMERNFDQNIQGIDKKNVNSAIVLIYGSIPARCSYGMYRRYIYRYAKRWKRIFWTKSKR